MSEHARLSPSGAHRWSRCSAALLIEEKLPDKGSKYADEGTAAHELASWILGEERTKADAEALIGVLGIEVNGDVWPITQEMVDHCFDYAKLVREYAEGGSLLVEQRVEFSTWVDVPKSFGTSDAVILKNDQIIVVDLKYGMGERVDANENEQLMLYALGALHEFSWFANFKDVVMVIHQPRLNHVSEYTVDVDHLKAFADRMKDAAKAALTPNTDFNPGEKQCRWCRAKATCPALRSDITEMVAADASDFDDLGDDLPIDTSPGYLAVAMDKVALIEGWCKAVRAEVERRLFEGQPVPGYKLVEGRLGARQWAHKDTVEQVFKDWRYRKDEMYEFALISPTKAEKVLASNPVRWAKLQQLIDRRPGKASVAPASDRRPAISPAATADDFGD